MAPSACILGISNAPVPGPTFQGQRSHQVTGHFLFDCIFVRVALVTYGKWIHVGLAPSFFHRCLYNRLLKQSLSNPNLQIQFGVGQFSACPWPSSPPPAQALRADPSRSECSFRRGVHAGGVGGAGGAEIQSPGAPHAEAHLRQLHAWLGLALDWTHEPPEPASGQSRKNRVPRIRLTALGVQEACK